MSRLERQIQSERKPEPKVLVTFYGQYHHPQNLEDIDVVKTKLSDLMARVRGKKVIFFEGTSTASFVNNLGEEVRSYGGVGNRELAITIFRQTGYRPSKYEVANRRQRIENMSLEEIFEKDLVSSMECRTVFERIAIEEAIAGQDVKLEYETHPKKVVDEVVELTGRYEVLQEQAFDEWKKKNFDLA